jgi:hypothetical protein
LFLGVGYEPLAQGKLDDRLLAAASEEGRHTAKKEHRKAG